MSDLSTTPPVFNLLTERWIPVLRTNGRADRIGIRAALAEAGSIRQIAASNPMDNVALLRFLLAVLIWCKPGLDDKDQRRLEGASGIPEEWLSENLGTVQGPKSLFNLLGPGSRFMQAPEGACNSRPAADLFHELPGGTNVVHLYHIQDYQDGACPACIAIGLVRLPVAMTGKGAGKRPGINGDPPLYVLPIGRTLLESIRLNLPMPASNRDAPCWVRNQHSTEHGVSIMEGFTWTSRQFRIASQRSGRCMLCNDKTDSLVTGLAEVNAPNGREDLSRCPRDRWRDPHLAYDSEGKPCRAEDAEKNLPGSAGQWRDWLRQHTADDSGEYQPDVAILATAIATRQNDKSIEAITLSTRRRGGIPAEAGGLNELNDVVTKLLDPHVTLPGKRLMQFKNRHPLKVLRHRRRSDPKVPLSEAVRAAMADRLPGIETRMWHAFRSQPAATGLQAMVEAGEWRATLEEIGAVTTPGSPLRRREAVMRARSVLEAMVRNAAPSDKGSSTANSREARDPTQLDSARPDPKPKRRTRHGA